MPNFAKCLVFISCPNCNDRPDPRSITGGNYLLKCPKCGKWEFRLKEGLSQGVGFNGQPIKGARYITCMSCSWDWEDSIQNASCPHCGSWEADSVGFTPL